MDKFYVQCGPISVVLVAENAQAAAMSALDRMLQSHLWIYDDQDLTERQRHDHLMIEALLHLDPQVKVSRRGFDSKEFEFHGTPEVVERWHELMTGMSRLFVAAGIPKRRMEQFEEPSEPQIRPGRFAK